MKTRDIFFYAIAIAVLSLVVIFSIFYRIDANPLEIWDEARVAVSSLEMSQSHNYFIPTYDGQPDMWSVKPPLMIVVQSFSMKFFGYNELGVRMPTAIAAVATALVLLWFCSYVLQNFLAGFCSVVFLCTSSGYICQHVARTGDYDTLLIFFLTAYFVFALCYIIKEQYKYYLLFNIFLLLALFTKGIAGVFFLPGIFIGFVFQKGMFKKLLRLKFLLPPLFIVGCFLSYYIIREQYNAGYIQTVIFEEMKGRMFDSKFDTDTRWYYFFENMVSSAFNPWWVFIPLSILGYRTAKEFERKTILIAGITLFIFWIPLTIYINKNTWYFAPSYPLLSLIASITFSVLADKLSSDFTSRFSKKIVLSVTVIVLCFFPVFNAYKNSEQLNERFGFAELVKSKKIPANAIILSAGYNSPVVFYQKALALRGTNVLVSDMNGVNTGNTVIAITSGDVNRVKQQFSCDVLYANKETEMLYLKEKL